MRVLFSSFSEPVLLFNHVVYQLNSIPFEKDENKIMTGASFLFLINSIKSCFCNLFSCTLCLMSAPPRLIKIEEHSGQTGGSG